MWIKNHCNAVEGSAYTCTAICRCCVDFCVIPTNIAVYRGSALPKNMNFRSPYLNAHLIIYLLSFL